MKKINEEIHNLIKSMGNIKDIMRQWDEYKGILHSLKVWGEYAVEPLIEALKDANRQIRYGAVLVLGDIKDTRAVEPLINALKDENSDVRRQAAVSLGIIGDIRAVKPLIELLKDEDESNSDLITTVVPLSHWNEIGSVRQWAMDGLMRLGRPALEMLKEAVNDENQLVRSGAQRAINMIEGRNAHEKHSK